MTQPLPTTHASPTPFLHNFSKCIFSHLPPLLLRHFSIICLSVSTSPLPNHPDTPPPSFYQSTLLLLQCVEYLLYQGALVDDFECESGGNLLHLALECSMEAEDNRFLCLKVLLCTTLKQEINQVDDSGVCYFVMYNCNQYDEH